MAEDPVTQLADRLKALADPPRLRLLKLLQCDAYCVCELGELPGMHQPSERSWGRNSHRLAALPPCCGSIPWSSVARASVGKQLW